MKFVAAKSLKVVAGLVAASNPGGQQMQPTLLISDSAIFAAFQAISGQNYCFAYQYDHNGNRLSKTDVTYSSTGTWGSSTYGCFNWTP